MAGYACCDGLRTCDNRLDRLLARDKAERPQFVAVQIDFHDRQDQEKSGRSVGEDQTA
jgi:hypothetical protein